MRQTVYDKSLGASDWNKYNDTDNYGDLLGTQLAWLASSCVSTNSSEAYFRVHFVSSSYVSAISCWYSDGYSNASSCALRPLVTLSSSLLIDDGDGTESAPYKLKSATAESAEEGNEGVNTSTSKVIIGSNDETVGTTIPVIQGYEYGIDSESGFEFYDGISKGGIEAIKGGENIVTAKPDNYRVEYGEETIDLKEYETAWLELDKFTITFNANAEDANVSPPTKEVTYGLAIGELPIPTRNGYHFDCWNTKADGIGETYTKTTIYSINDDITLYAHWTSNYSVDGKHYPTLESAYNAVSGNKGTIIVIRDNIDSSNLIVEEGKEIILDTNGYTITLTSSSGSTAINNKGKLTIKGNGNIKTSNNSISNDNTGVLNIIENTQILSPNIEYGISNVGNGKVTLKRGKIY